jgi:hypothetical protein
MAISFDWWTSKLADEVLLPTCWLHTNCFSTTETIVEVMRLLRAVIDGDRRDDPRMMLAHHLVTAADRGHHLLPGSLHGCGHRSQPVLHPGGFQDFDDQCHIPAHVGLVHGINSELD